MSPPKRLSRLNRFVGLPGGMTADMALAQADRNLEAHREVALAGVDDALAAMTEALAAPDGGDASSQQEIYRLAYEIGAVAGLYDMVAMGLAAQSLCELIDNGRARGVWDGVGAGVHLAAIRLLRRPAQNVGAAEAEVLKGLTRIVQRNGGAG